MTDDEEHLIVIGGQLRVFLFLAETLIALLLVVAFWAAAYWWNRAGADLAIQLLSKTMEW